MSSQQSRGSVWIFIVCQKLLFPKKLLEHITKRLRSVSWFLGPLVSWFLGFKKLPKFHVVFWIDIDLISKLSQEHIRRIGVIYRRPSFPNSTTFWMYIILRFVHTHCLKMFQGGSSILFRCLGVSKNKNDWFWEPGTHPKVPKS